MSQIADGTVKFTVRDSRLNSLLEILYPVGSIKITVSSEAPFSDLGFGTWEEVSKGRVLRGADDRYAAGSTVKAGLPNIKGTFTMRNGFDDNPVLSTEGVFYTGTHVWIGNHSSFDEKTESDRKLQDVKFDASRSNSIYGKSDTVTPLLRRSFLAKDCLRNLRVSDNITSKRWCDVWKI